MVSHRRFWGYLRIQVLLLMLVVLLLPLGGVGWLYYNILSTDLKSIEKAHALQVSASAHRLLDQLGQQLSGSTISNAKWKDNLDAVNNNDIQWIEDNVNVSLDVIPGMSFLATIDNQGKVISQAGDVAEFTGEISDHSIVEAVAEKVNIYGMIQTSEGLAVIAASQITDEQSVEASTAILIFGKLLDNESLLEISKILNAGIAIRSIDDQRIGSSPEMVNLLTAKAAIPVAGVESSFHTGEQNGVRQSEVKSGYPGMSGASVVELIVSVPAEASGTVQKEMIRLSGIAGLLAVILIIIISIILRRRIIVPLVSFDTFLQEVSSGQLSGVLPLKVRGRVDEIGSIARSLQDMVAQIKKLVSDIRSTATDSVVAAGQLTGDADTAAVDANRIADSMLEVAAGADSQATGMKRGAEVTREIQNSMVRIGDRTTSVAIVAEQTNRQASEGNDTIQFAAEQMKRIAQTAEVSVKDAHHLQEKSNQIGKMVEAISAIASRTNILALNANIEASRAGEQGKSFAVVAGEVRKLAIQSDVTASDISREIGEIQEGITAVMRRIEEGYKEIQSGAELVNQAGQAFQGISLGVGDMEEELREIAGAGQEINERIEELSTLVIQTEAISESSAERSQDVAGIAGSQMMAVRRVADAMSSLSQRIRDLEQAVNRFK